MSTSKSSVVKENAVTVGVRVRPLNESEKKSEMIACFTASEDASAVVEYTDNGEMSKDWPIDYAFGENCTNEFIFKTFGEPLVDFALEGFNTVLFMYGQTSSGKTFTLFGGGEVEGIVGHSLEYVYKRCLESNDSEYIIKVSYAELYNEELKDLLSPTPNESLKIFDDPLIGPIIQGITQVTFTTASEIKLFLQEGENRRHFGVTNMNAHSSRSHVLVRMHIESRRIGIKPNTPFRNNWGRDKPTTISTLNLVDLAGSERANKSGTSGQALKEGSYINKSLLTLGTVISNLSDGKNSQHIPYRDSKLTRLLASALGGNAKTFMITCISPASGNISESLSTLRFATRAKRIVNHAQKNEFLEVKSLATKFAQQKAELDELRERFELSKQLGFFPDGEQGQTLRLKAVAATKKLKVLKFFISHVPKIIKFLQRQSNFSLSKQLQSDLRQVLTGHKDAIVTIEEHHELLIPFFDEDDTMMVKLRAIVTAGEFESFQEDPLEIDPYAELDSDNLDMLTSTFDCDDLLEKYEFSQMTSEDMLMKHCAIVHGLKHEIAERIKSETVLLDRITLLSEIGADNHDMIKKYTAIDEQRMKDMEALQLQLDKETMSLKQKSITETEQLSQIKEYKNTLSANQILIKSLHDGMMALKVTHEESTAANEKLQLDLQQANHSRKSFEEELHKTRNDMRTQLDRLRANMNLMMKTGGDESRILEAQNSDFAKENDTLKDQLSIMSITQMNLTAEIAQVRNELQRLRDSVKSYSEENTRINVETSYLKRELHTKDVEISEALGRSASFETKYTVLQRKFQAEIDKKIILLSDVQQEHEQRLKTKESYIKELRDELNEVNNIRHGLKNELDSKISISMKSEQNYIIEVKRLEKKNSDIAKRMARLQCEFRESLAKLNETIVSLNRDKQELLVQLSIVQEKQVEPQRALVSEDDVVDDDMDMDMYLLQDDEVVGDMVRRSSYSPLPFTLSFGHNKLDSLSFDSTRASLVPQSYDTSFSTVVPFMDPSIDNTTSSDEMYQAYLEKRLSYAMISEFSNNMEYLDELSNCSRYSSLRHALEISSLSLSYIIRGERLLRDYLLSETLNTFDNDALKEQNIRDLYSIQSTLLQRQHQFEIDIQCEIEKNIALHTLNDSLKTQMHECKLRISELCANDNFKSNRIVTLEKEIATATIYVDNAKYEIDLATSGKAELIKVNKDLEIELAVARKELIDLEKRHHRLHQQASAIEKERNEIVEHFINLKP